MDTKDDDVTKARKERRRLYAIEYRKQNAEKLKERHQWRLDNDADYAKRYREKQERRNHRYQESHADAVAARNERRIQLAIARDERERERQRKQKAKSRRENPEKHREYAIEYKARNRDEINAKRRERWNNDLKFRSKMLYASLKSKYKVTEVQYADLYIAQNGRCAICRVSEAELGITGLVMDHCHSKGHVRGLLCNKCNTALGGFKDSIEVLNSAIAYLTNDLKE